MQSSGRRAGPEQQKTVKNRGALKMIVGASSNPGDLVVDPFCGSGTTLDAADQLGRRWLGMDESFVALAAATKRLGQPSGSTSFAQASSA
ncbi:MAG: DNA methyltransferase [Gemmobacter sp.]